MQRIKPGVNPIGTIHKVDMPGFGEVKYRVFSIQESGPGQPDLVDPMVVMVYADVKRFGNTVEIIRKYGLSDFVLDFGNEDAAVDFINRNFLILNA